MSSSSQRQANSYSRRAPFHDDTNNQSLFRNQPNRNEPPLNRGRGYNEHQGRRSDAMPNRGILDAQTIAMTAIMIEEMMEEATRIRGFNTQGDLRNNQNILDG